MRILYVWMIMTKTSKRGDSFPSTRCIIGHFADRSHTRKAQARTFPSHLKMSVDRKEYETFVKQLVTGQRSKIMTREKGKVIIKFLKGEISEELSIKYNTPKFRFYVRSKGFEVLKTDIPGFGVDEYLFQKVVEHGGKKNRNKNVHETISYRRVAYMEDFYDILKQFHNHDNDNTTNSKGSVGYKRCLRSIQEKYSLFPRSCIQSFCNMCTICKRSRTDYGEHKYSGTLPKVETEVLSSESFNFAANLSIDTGAENDDYETEPSADLSVNRPNPFIAKLGGRKQERPAAVDSSSNDITDVFVYKNELAPPKIPVAQPKSFMEQCQLEIIEMDDMDQNYLYLGHFIDVYSNYHVLFPLVNKSVAAVVQGLGISVFAYFGTPKTLQSSQGPKFLTPIINKIHANWPNRGNCTLGNIYPNRSTGNLLTFSSEKDVKDIFKILAGENLVNERHIPWVKWIPLAQYRLNTQVQELNNRTAYQMVLKQLPRSISIRPLPTDLNTSPVSSTPKMSMTVVNVPDVAINPSDIIEIDSSQISEAGLDSACT